MKHALISSFWAPEYGIEISKLENPELFINLNRYGLHGQDDVLMPALASALVLTLWAEREGGMQHTSCDMKSGKLKEWKLIQNSSHLYAEI